MLLAVVLFFLFSFFYTYIFYLGTRAKNASIQDFQGKGSQKTFRSDEFLPKEEQIVAVEKEREEAKEDEIQKEPEEENIFKESTVEKKSPA